MSNECPYSITPIRNGKPGNTIYFDSVTDNGDGTFTLSQTLWSGWGEYTQGEIGLVEHATTPASDYEVYRDVLENQLVIAPEDWHVSA